MNFSQFTHLTFDCYGTLIDWETGILSALEPILEAHNVQANHGEVLRLYAKHESEHEAGPHKIYRDVLKAVLTDIGSDLGLVPSSNDLSSSSSSVSCWPPFPDTVHALKWLRRRYKLVIVSNVDDDLFAQTQTLLGLQFDEIITAQQVGAYKPSKAMFNSALQRLNVPKEQILHIAQSLYHDHVPAKEMGFTTVWVNRPSILPGFG